MENVSESVITTSSYIEGGGTKYNFYSATQTLEFYRGAEEELSVEQKEAEEHPFNIAKSVVDEKRGTTNYYIKTYNSNIINPWGDNTEGNYSIGMANRPPVKFRKVEKLTFDLVLKFLRTKNGAYLRQAQRNLI